MSNSDGNNDAPVGAPSPVPEEIKPGDNMCISCTGILVYSKAMRQHGQKPVCVGARKTLKYPVTEESVMKIDEKQAKRRQEDLFVCIGYARETGRMERKGHTPLCVDGIAIARYPDLPVKENTTSQEGGVPPPVHLPPPVPIPSMQVIDEIAGKVTKSAVKNVDTIGKFWAASLTDFPEKFERSATTVATSMAATPPRVGRAFSKVCSMMFGDDEDA